MVSNGIMQYNHEGMELPVANWGQDSHSFQELANIIQTTHDAAQTSAVKAINRMQTMSLWDNLTNTKSSTLSNFLDGNDETSVQKYPTRRILSGKML